MQSDLKDEENTALDASSSSPESGEPRVEGDLQYISTTLQLLVDEAGDMRDRAERGHPVRYDVSMRVPLLT